MKNSDQPAFAYGFANEMSHKESHGLTKREYFAGLAMQGVLSHNHPQTPTPNQAEDIAKYAVEIADALLKQLEQ